MPTGKPIAVMEYHMQLGSEWDIDFTLLGNPEYDDELRRRYERNIRIKKKLLSGQNAFYRTSGWSLYPYVSANNGCTYKPVTEEDQVQKGDIVFCEVRSWCGGRITFYAHMVLEAELDSSGKMRYIIGNAIGHQNGWCHIEHIYGRLVKVDK